jgi:Ser/Thr protein kinase RdoA (MazF antagonist)
VLLHHHRPVLVGGGVVKFEYTSVELRRMASLLDYLNQQTVKVVSPRADAVLHLDGEETPLALLMADDGTYYLSLVVPL